MYSYVKSSAKVIGVVAVGAGIVAIGWLGWKAYAKVSAKVVQVDESKDEVNIVPPKDDEKVTEVPEAVVGDLDQKPNSAPRRKKKSNTALWNASYQRRLARKAKEREERADREQQVTPAEGSEDADSTKVCETAAGNLDEEPSGAPSLDAVQDVCAADSIVDPVVVIVDEDASPSADLMCDSIKEGASSEPAAVPACAEHPVISTQQEIVEDVLAIQGKQLVDGIADAVADAPVGVGRKKKPNKALWNASCQRRLAKKANERAERAAREQQADAVVQDPCAVDSIVDTVVVVVEEDTSVSVGQMDDSVKEGTLPEPAADPACTEHPVIVTRHELVGDVPASEGEQLVDGIVDAVADAPVPTGRKKKPNKALWNASYQRRLAKKAKERAERAALEQAIVAE
ncbi:Uncharacterized protein APZ42_022481 [Daphnia magna]|uniref:Uncharacterized protein n=1 Tax=Daphnia magna TaxID=35525 RepID=A0A164VIC4_9CRUS|nr:Uncharacterized protein APZ42_022481 [Daphnia magna]